MIVQTDGRDFSNWLVDHCQLGMIRCIEGARSSPLARLWFQESYVEFHRILTFARGELLGWHSELAQKSWEEEFNQEAK